ncbi:hypothetical protein SteCoe_22939 [Stentor coeruleus]|uniref:Uncharacterized protein n=1 Tax=Stentor coeruleus TaxID=5963 RepID=A0A1R2BKY7_9CILI|nr:hypothetical protein SteCoe_22939 [Stentor coeruleus]
MELVACLWSYDDRWMFESKFTKGAWMLSFGFQSVICLSSAIIGFYSTEIDMWIGFRVLISLGLACCCLLLAITYESRRKTVRKQWSAEILVSLAGIINLILTWNLVNFFDQSEYIRYSSQVQILLYILVLALPIITSIGCILVKVSCMIISILFPRAFIKIKPFKH